MNAENTAYAFQIRKLLIFVVAILFPLLIFLVPTNQDFTPQLRTYFVITFFIIILMAKGHYNKDRKVVKIQNRRLHT